MLYYLQFYLHVGAETGINTSTNAYPQDYFNISQLDCKYQLATTLIDNTREGGVMFPSLMISIVSARFDYQHNYR